MEILFAANSISEITAPNKPPDKKSANTLKLGLTQLADHFVKKSNPIYAMKNIITE